MSLLVAEVLQDGLIHGRVHAGLAKGTAHLQGHSGAWNHEHHAGFAQGLVAVVGVQAPWALDPVVPAKLLVGHEVPHRLPEMRIRDLRKKVTLRRRQVEPVKTFQEVGAAGVRHPSRGQPLRHRGEVHGCPVLVEVLVRHIAPVLALDAFHALADLGVGTHEGGVGGSQSFDEANGLIHSTEQALPRGADHLRVLGHQVAHRRESSPSRLCGVADVGHTTDTQLAADEVADHRPVVIRHPTPNAMQADEVEVGKICASSELGEGLVGNLCAVARTPGQCPGRGRLGGVEVGAPPLGTGGRGMNGEADPLPVSQLACVFKGRGCKARHQERQPDACRIEFGVVAVGVLKVRDISIAMLRGACIKR